VTVAAVMPVKEHHPDYLRKAVESVVGQTSPDWRLLVVVEEDGHATLGAFLEPYLRDPRIELLVNEGRKLAGAFNTGMRHAGTEFVAILFADDMWTRDAVAVLSDNVREHPEVDFFHSARAIVGGRDEPLSSVHPAPDRVSPKDFRRFSPVKHLLCWRREKALSIGGMDESLNSVGPDDFDFPWSMAEAGAIFRAIPECLYLYRDHRACFRLTTHLPLSVHTGEIRRIMRKHGVGRLTTEWRVLQARRTFLRQCLFRSDGDRGTNEGIGIRPDLMWRDSYR
jgi:O-antigen biosynthesis protein